MENIISLNRENIEHEHICCAIADKKSAEGVNRKKQWIIDHIDLGYKFKKVDVRGKAFIEYLPAEYAWAPIIADGYMYIGCFWVSGSHAGKGYGTALLNECKSDSKDLNGIVAITTSKKRTFLSDKKFYHKNGFEICDNAKPDYELLVLRNNKNAKLPTFGDTVRNLPEIDNALHIYHTYQCPFIPYYIQDLKNMCDNAEIKLKIHCIDNLESARNCPNPFPLYAVYYKGKFITNQILSNSSFNKMILSL